MLVTGGAGFVGSHIARSYRDSGSAVRVPLHRRHGAWAHASAEDPAAADFPQLDVLDLDEASSNIFADQDLVIHAAAMIRADGLDERVRQRKVNVDGTRNVIDACRRHGVPRLLYVSTTAAIGISANPAVPADEAFEFNLDHLDLGYNATKREAEQLVLAANGPDLETVVVNPGVVFGWDGRSYRGADVMRRVLRRTVVVCTPGGLSIVHVDDVVNGLRLVATRGVPGTRYILSGENVSFRQIADTVTRLFRKRRLVVSIPDSATDVALRVLRSRLGRMAGAPAPLYLDRRLAYQYYSSEKARRELGYAPRPFASIVEDAIDHGVGAL